MKPHLMIKLRNPLSLQYIPHWIKFITDKSEEVQAFGNSIDPVLQKYDTSYWVTREYEPANKAHFSEHEIINGLNRIYRIILKQDYYIPEQVIQEIRILPEVEDVRKGEIGQVEIPPKAVSQSMGFTMDKARKDIYLREAHLFGKGDPEIKIAILDTGIDVNHQELQNTISKKADFVNLEGLNTSSFIGDTLGYDDTPYDEVGHGTHVAGIIAAKGVRMPEGVAPLCKLMVVRVLATLNQDGKMVGAGLLDNINVGIKWAVDNGADVINMSLGTKQEHGGLPHQDVIQYALDKGVSIIAASGNDGSGDKYYPGALPGVMAVSAVDSENNVAGFSNYGAHVTMAAPGTNIYSSYINQTYAFSSGTSQAAPFVTGAVALLKSYGLQFGVKLKDNQVKYILKHTCDKLDRRFKNSKSGYGKLNLLDALKLLKYQLNN